jgi:hypothetical protein
LSNGESKTETGFAVYCRSGCNPGGEAIHLTEEEYTRQLSRPDARWSCPRCGEFAVWSDAIYEKYMEEMEELADAQEAEEDG